MRHCIIITLFLSLSLHINGQEERPIRDKPLSFTLSIAGAYRYEPSSAIDRKEFSHVGVEGLLEYRLSKKTDLQLKASYFKWDINRETSIPLLIGPKYKLIRSANIDLGIYGVAGPGLLIGNDYAGIFATVETGLQADIGRKKNIVIGVGWGRGLFLHPSEFGIVRAAAGWRF